MTAARVSLAGLQGDRFRTFSHLLDLFSLSFIIVCVLRHCFVLGGSEAVPGPATGVASDAGGAAAAAAKSEPAERVESEEVAATEEPNVDDSHDQQEGGEEEKKENDPSLDVD